MARDYRRGFFLSALHVVVLSSFAFAQPLYAVLSRHAEFFVARHSEPLDVILFTLLVVLGPSALLLFIEGVAGILGRRIQERVHVIIVALLAACVFLPMMKQGGERHGTFLLAGAVFSGILTAMAYQRFVSLRLFVSMLSPALVIFPGFFLFGSPVNTVIFRDNRVAVAETTVHNAVPVVMVVFDEFPVTSLMDEARRIDAIRYPNFALLARDATWFRNATTVHGNTLAAVPAILSGRYPKSVSFPTAQGYPQTLFTLLGGSYALNVIEPYTALCPEFLCEHYRHEEPLDQRLVLLFSDLSLVYLHIVLPEELTTSLPAVTQTWEDFAGKAGTALNEITRERTALEEKAIAALRDREAVFSRFVHSITVTDKPTVHFLHSMLPHIPWEFLPSGKRYQGSDIPGLNIKKEEWGEDEWLVMQGYQRHLLQVGFVDKLVGDLLTRLKELGLYDDSLIVITADHGASFWPRESRRGASSAHFHDIAGVPLFIKKPYQREGVLSDVPLQTIDILPTVADILGIQLSWSVDGRSQADTAVLGPVKAPPTSHAELLATAAKTLKYKLALFGSGTKANGLFRIGPYKELIGQ
ncbi:MAG: sulfatase-like hydrolase/transferase, partial [Candidatus Binatia bacterium]